FFNDTATTEIYTLSLHDALPICSSRVLGFLHHAVGKRFAEPDHAGRRQSAASAVRWDLGQRSAPVRPVGAAHRTPHAPDVAVQLEHAAAARTIVQAVH